MAAVTGPSPNLPYPTIVGPIQHHLPKETPAADSVFKKTQQSLTSCLPSWETMKPLIRMSTVACLAANTFLLAEALETNDETRKCVENCAYKMSLNAYLIHTFLALFAAPWGNALVGPAGASLLGENLTYCVLNCYSGYSQNHS